MSTSKERFHAAYREALGWLRREGLAVTGSRFETYDDAIARFVADGGLRGTLSDQEKLLTQDALLAATDLNTAHAQFGGRALSVGLRERLAKMLEGDGIEREERPGEGASTAGRDFGFEVMFGAHLDAVGLAPEFPKVGDVELIVQGSDILIECKRPQFEHSVERAVVKAAVQISKRAKTAKRLPVGMIALSLGKLFRGGEKLLSAPSADAAREEVHRAVGQLVTKFEGIWQPGRFPGVHAVYIQLDAPVHVVPSDDFLAACIHGHNPIVAEERGPEFYALREVTEKLRLRTDFRYRFATGARE